MASDHLMTVLVVDDEPLQLDLMRRVLEKAGFRVLAAGSGPDAIRVFESVQGEIDLLVSDVVMPGMEGPELAARLRERKRGLRVLFVSGFLAQYEWVAYGADADHQRLLAKPFSPSILIREVNEVLAR